MIVQEKDKQLFCDLFEKMLDCDHNKQTKESDSSFKTNDAQLEAYVRDIWETNWTFICNIQSKQPSIVNNDDKSDIHFVEHHRHGLCCAYKNPDAIKTTMIVLIIMVIY